MEPMMITLWKVIDLKDLVLDEKISGFKEGIGGAFVETSL
jgi:hypothetical protein